MPFSQRCLMLLFGLFVALLITPDRGWAQPQQQWTQWMQTTDCSMGRHHWLSVAQTSPGFGWIMSPGARFSPTQAGAFARLDVLRLSMCQADMMNCPSFKQHCCQMQVWENTQTKAMTMVEEGNTPGGGFIQVAPSMCCEDAAAVMGSDPLNCTTLSLTSVSGTVTIGPTGPVSLTGTVTIPDDPPMTVAALATPTGAGAHLGCFKDPNNPYNLDGYLDRSDNNTPQRCIEVCRQKGFAYAGVEWSQSCLCGNSYDKFGPADNCNMPCTGDPNKICGGFGSNDVYTTGIQAP